MRPNNPKAAAIRSRAREALAKSCAIAPILASDPGYLPRSVPER